MRLPDEEWLHFAKGTGIGSQRRVRHRTERSPDMIVGNTEDRWWAYCQRCKAGGVVMKAHVLVGSVAPKESASLLHPTDARLIPSLAAYERDALTLLLARKSMDWMYFDGIPVSWSVGRQRLLLHTPSGLMGRDTTERSSQKWLTYDRQHSLAPSQCHTATVLVEDPFSWAKVAYALRAANVECGVLCTLGTAIHDSAYLWCLKNTKRVWSFYDGDAAGWKGSLANARRLQGAGLYGGGSNAIADCAPSGLDPKDMNLGDIAQHVQRLLATL